MGRKIAVEKIIPGQIIYYYGILFCTQFLTSETWIGKRYWIDDTDAENRDKKDRALKVFINETGRAISLPLCLEVELIENKNASN